MVTTIPSESHSSELQKFNEEYLSDVIDLLLRQFDVEELESQREEYQQIFADLFQH